MKVRPIFLCCLFFVALLLPLPAEIFTWKTSTSFNFVTTKTTNEYIKIFNDKIVKPEQKIELEIAQRDALVNKSTVPYIKNLLTFPSTSIQVGDSWKGQASIEYSLLPFGIDTSQIVPVEVTYTLAGTEVIDSRTYYKIFAQWVPFFIFPEKLAKSTGVERITGFSTTELLWDLASGGPKQTSITEEIQYRFTDKTSLYKNIKTLDKFTTVIEMQRKKVIQDLTKKIQETKVENVEVKQSDQGIVLSIEDINFEADSSVLLASEKKKIDKIGSLLASLTTQKLKVIGHAANLAGSDEKELLDLSSSRAESVAHYLVETKIKPSDMIVSLGMGGSAPIDTNETTEGRSRNRRVEIVIMDEVLENEPQSEQAILEETK